ncbi:hypothetical protein ACFE04_006767 [Oxalis oulophora]
MSLFLITVFFFEILTKTFCLQHDDYSECTRLYNCGNITNVGFPFWGNNRPQFCGHKEFELKCNDDQESILKIDKMKFLVLGIDSSDYIMTIARVDLSLNLCCPRRFDAANLGKYILYRKESNQHLCLFYNCTLIPSADRYKFYCSGSFPGQSNVQSTVNYYVNYSEGKGIGAVAMPCWKSLIVPILKTNVKFLSIGTSRLQEVLAKGFEVEYSQIGKLCDSCNKSGGACIFASESFCCITGSENDCYQIVKSYQSESSGIHSFLVRKLVAGVGAAVVGGILLVCSAYCWLRKKTLFQELLISCKKTEADDRTVEAIIRNSGSLFQQSYTKDIGECAKPYVCGNITARNPFWGSDDWPEFCLHIGFNLSCEMNQYPVLEMAGSRFRVLEINETASTMKFARIDLWESPCVHSGFGTTSLDDSIFDFVHQLNLNLTLFFNCTIPQDFGNSFNCSTNDHNQIASNNFYLSDSIFSSYLGNSCYEKSIKVPILKTSMKKLISEGPSSLQEALNGGFVIDYSHIRGEMCHHCEEGGGLCVYNNNTFLCISTSVIGFRINWSMKLVIGTTFIAMRILVVPLLVLWLMLNYCWMQARELPRLAASGHATIDRVHNGRAKTSGARPLIEFTMPVPSLVVFDRGLANEMPFKPSSIQIKK